jgi:hypothetical protein
MAPIWADCGVVNMKRLKVAQNNAFRAIFGIGFGMSVKYLFDRHKILRIDKFLSYLTSIYAYKNFNGMLRYQATIRMEIPLERDRRFQTLLLLPRVNMELTKRSLYYRLAEAWNDMSPNMRIAPSLTGFKRLAKEKLLVEQLNEE